MTQTPYTKTLFNLLIGLLLTTQFALASNSLQEVKQRFATLIEARQQFNIEALDYYADDAVICHRENTPIPQVTGLGYREKTLSGKKFVLIQKRIWETAREFEDVWVYSDLKFKEAGDSVRIKGKRYSKLRDVEYPYEVHFKKDENASWMISYEYLETKVIPDIRKKISSR